MESYNPGLMRGIIDQVNQSDIDTTIFTNKIGEDKGIRSRGCGACFTKLWDRIWGVSYDKTTVISRINETFRGALDQQLFCMDKSALRTFSAQLQYLDTKLSKNNGFFDENLQVTITRIDSFLDSQASRQSSRRRKNRFSAHRTAMPRPESTRRSDRTTDMSSSVKSTSTVKPAQKPEPRVDVQAQAKAEREAEAARNKEQNQQTLLTFAEEVRQSRLNAIQRIYAQSETPQKKVFDWILETTNEMSELEMLEQPQSKAAIESKFNEILEAKICGFNLNVIEKRIPDLFTNPEYDLGSSDWHPDIHNFEAPLIDLMKTIPFSKTAAKHVRAKLRLPEVLELPLQGFTKRELKTAYKKLSLRYHPDKNMGNKAAAAKFTEVCEAYQTLLKRFE